MTTPLYRALESYLKPGDFVKAYRCAKHLLPLVPPSTEGGEWSCEWDGLGGPCAIHDWPDVMTALAAAEIRAAVMSTVILGGLF